MGSVPRAVYDRLCELFRDPWQPFVCAGRHECNLCRFNAEASAATNLFVPGDGALYVCPELILHYINAHGYAPPEAFCNALLQCPDTRTIDYKRRLIASGWKDAADARSQNRE